MKIQCDVCHKEEASVFCPSDEAALCHGCDHTIHHANKLAGKHKRFSLHPPTSKDTPLCDICHERHAYLFCQEDRTILCRECDIRIHGANEHTQKHNRFFLTAVKLSDTKSLSFTGSEVTTSRSKENRPSSFSNENISSSRMVEVNMGCDSGNSVSTNSISEYLIDTIPGYCMEDLLDASFALNGFYKDYDYQSAFQDQDFQVSMCSFPMQAWVPQSQLNTSNLTQNDSFVGVKEVPKAKAAEGYSNWRYNNGYTSHSVPSPSISPSFIKKCRRFR
ncbi:B-box zinc finger protein 20-like [Gastrolobium bilobum]|uniref:B-box zinc finger protein 20-like n=1 Tax=Gastrolobium bilobum TaxID=150636 RepID=UPI002AB11316|nr:B-box zinc finger protein 20-like [Gastrolobium bilobum]